MKQRPLLTAFMAVVTFAAAVNTHAQIWQTILPSPIFSSEGPPYGRALLVEPTTTPGTLPRLLLGVVDYSGSDTVIRVAPDATDYSTGDIVGVDNRLPFVCQLAEVPGEGIYAVGRIEVPTVVKNKRTVNYYWQVRKSPSVDAGTWVDMGAPYIRCTDISGGFFTGQDKGLTRRDETARRL